MKTNKNTILLVEDEKALLDVLEYRLQEEGFQVFTAENGEDGLKKGFEHKPDLVVFDIMMPQMDGIMMFNKIRTSGKWGKKVPLMVLTNLSENKQVFSESSNPPFGYFIKSDWKLEDIISRIKDRFVD